MESNSSNQECPIWRHFRHGDPMALATIFSEHYDSLYYYGKKLVRDDELVKDCVQNLFVKMWTSRARLMAVRFVKPYMLKALRRHIGDQVVAMNRKRAFQEEFVDDFQITFSHEDLLIARQVSTEQSEALTKSLNKLTGRQREAIFLKFYEGLDYEKIADVMLLNVQSVRNLVHQGLKTIKQHITMRTSSALIDVERNGR